MPEEKTTLTATQLLQLKHELNKEIKYGSGALNALEIHRLQDVGDWGAIKKRYREYYPTQTSIFAREWVTLIGFAVAAGMYYYLPDGWKWTGFVLFAFIIT